MSHIHTRTHIMQFIPIWLMTCCHLGTVSSLCIVTNHPPIKGMFDRNRHARPHIPHGTFTYLRYRVALAMLLIVFFSIYPYTIHAEIRLYRKEEVGCFDTSSWKAVFSETDTSGHNDAERTDSLGLGPKNVYLFKNCYTLHVFLPVFSSLT